MRAYDTGVRDALEKLGYALQDALGDIAAAGAYGSAGWNEQMRQLGRAAESAAFRRGDFANADRAADMAESYGHMNRGSEIAGVGANLLAPVGDSLKRRLLTPGLSASGAFVAQELVNRLTKNMPHQNRHPGYSAAAQAAGALAGRLALRGIDALKLDPAGATS